MSLDRSRLSRDNPKAIINQILNIFDRFSQVFGLKNYETKAIYGSKFNSEDIRMKSLTNYLIDEHEADIANIRFKGDEIE